MRKHFLFTAMTVLSCTAFMQPARAQISPSAFVTVWETNYAGYPVNSFTFVGVGNGYTIDVYDSSGATLLQTLNSDGTSSYTIGGVTYTATTISNLTGNTEYMVAVTPGSGSFTGFTGGGDSLCLLQVSQWGSTAWTSLNFFGCDQLTITAKDTPNLSGMTSINYMLGSYASTTDTIPNINEWDVSNVTDMSNAFKGAATFNQSLNKWNTGNVTNMSGMFQNATAFNQPLDNWDVSRVTDMSYMFYGAKSFNQSLGSWKLSNGSTVRGSGVRNLLAVGDGSPYFSNMLNYRVLNCGNYSNTFGAAGLQYSVYDASANSSDVRNLLAEGDASPDLSDMLDNSGLDCNNYSSTLIGWADGLGSTTPTDVTFGAAGLQYGAYASAARQALVDAGWQITDAGQGGCVPLPITLQSFTVQAQNHTALLQWTTATEINNKGFAVQRSADGANYATIAFVNSQALNGNSSIPQNYTYTDEHPLVGINYYRLAQTDLDGTVTYSNVQSVQFNSEAKVYPNPVQSQSALTVTGMQSAATYKLINTAGKTVLQGTLQAGNNNQIPINGIASGIYFLHIESNGVVNTYKIEVVK